MRLADSLPDRIQEQLRSWFQEQRFDVAVCDFLDAAVNFPEKPGIPTVLFQHNVESEIWRRHADTASDPVRRMMYKMEFAKMFRYEQAIVERYQHVIAVSEHDKELMAKWSETSRITVVPTGVDLEQYRPEPSPSPSEPLVMFVGAMDWEPNIDAVEYFVAEILAVGAGPGSGCEVSYRGKESRPASPETGFRVHRNNWNGRLGCGPFAAGGHGHCAASHRRRNASQDL